MSKAAGQIDGCTFHVLPFAIICYVYIIYIYNICIYNYIYIYISMYTLIIKNGKCHTRKTPANCFKRQIFYFNDIRNRGKKNTFISMKN